MRTTIILWLERATNRYWAIPGLVVLALLGALAAALSVPESQRYHGPLSWIVYDASASGARALLSAVAGGVMTVVGVLFSMTIVVLQQASAQFSPRVIETFIRSARSQFVFGFYIGTFVYCLLLVRQIREESGGGSAATPDVAIAFAILLASVCMALLIYYIHHVVHAIQSTRIIEAIVCEGIRTSDTMKDDSIRHQVPEKTVRQLEQRLPAKADIVTPRRGYFQALRWSRLQRFLPKEAWVLSMHAVGGDYVCEGDCLASIRSSRPLTRKEITRLQKFFAIGSQRTHAQDLCFSIRQLADIALRALSPGINDPTTAVESINGLRSILNRAITKPSGFERLRIDENRYIESPDTPFAELLSLSFDQILAFSREHLPVRMRVKEVLECLTRNADGEKRQALMDYSEKIDPAAERAA